MSGCPQEFFLLPMWQVIPLVLFMTSPLWAGWLLFIRYRPR